MAPERKKSRMNEQEPNIKSVNTEITLSERPDDNAATEASPTPLVGPTGPATIPSKRDSWYEAAWRSKAGPLTETARESISVAQGVTTEALAETGRQIFEASKRPGHLLNKNLRGSRKSIPIVAEPTRVHATSDSSDQSRSRVASGEKLKTLENGTEDKSGSKAEPPATPERKPVVLEEASLPPTPLPDTADTEDSKSVTSITRPQSWFGWWSRPGVAGSIKEQQEASGTPLPGTPDPEPARADTTVADLPRVVGPEDQRGLPAVEPATNATSARSWFGLWSSAQNQQAVAADVDGPDKGTQDQLPAVQVAADQDTAKPAAEFEGPVVDAVEIGAAERPKATGWAFWSQDKSSKGESPTQDSTARQVGELAVADTPSQSHPEAAQFNEQRDAPPAKEPPAKSGSSAKSNAGKNASTEKAPASSATEAPKGVAVTLKTTAAIPPRRKAAVPLGPNLILPSFTDTYLPAPAPTYIQQVGVWLAETLHINEGQTAAPHVYISPTKPVVRRAISLGVHGFFPAPLIQKVLGQPTGTSIRFANFGADAIKAWCQQNQPNVKDVSIEKVALEGEGLVGDRVNTLWKLMLNWLSHLRQADFILVNCHSQGVPVAIALVAKLVQLNCLAPNAKVGVCAMAGINLGPFLDYKSRLFGGSALELFDFCNSASQVSKAYAESLDICLRHGVRISYIGSLDDQLVSLESSLHCPLAHPYVNRAVFIDGRVHAPNFLTHLVIFATKLRNRGVSDHGLLRELSAPLAGSLVGGDGHSRVYDDLAVYRLAVNFTLESTEAVLPHRQAAPTRRTSISGYPTSTAAANALRRGSAGEILPGIGAVIAAYSAPKEANPFNLPWAVRGLLEESVVKAEFSEELGVLVKEFEQWKPASKALRDVKFRLEGVKSML